MREAVCPGSFDPITNGHVDIIERAVRVFDRVYVTVFRNLDKAELFTVEERLEMVRQATRHLPNVVVENYRGLVSDYVRERGITAIIRGLRAVSDFEYEFQMAQMNMRLNPQLDTFFMMTRPEHAYLSSSIVKTVARFGGDVSGLVPPVVAAKLAEKYGRG
ncbi:MAG: pantetheine-phosphate adenylyltransferase [Clostridia bacterium]|nr:pantetheine-phosphate adenylyltransferase [Clostridia bacterium]